MRNRIGVLFLALATLYAAVAATCALTRRPAGQPPGKPTTFGAAPVQPTTVASNPWFNVAAWFIDPANSSTCAADTNDCQASSGSAPHCPCLTFNQIVGRWGTYSPRIQQQTIITWLSSQSGGGDAVKLQPYIESGGQLIILGTATTAATVNINGAGFQAKSYSSNLELNANLTASGAVGQFLNNQTHASVAWAFKFVSANVFGVSQPLNPNATPASVYPIPEVDTWTNGGGGDSVKLQTFPLVDLVDLEPRSDDSQGVAPCVVAGVTVMAPNATIGSDNFTIGPNVTLQSVRSLKAINVVAPNVGSLAWADASAGIVVPATACINCALEAGMTVNGGGYVENGFGSVFQVIGGYLHSPAFGQGGGAGTTSLQHTSLDGDVILAGGNIDGGTGNIAVLGGSFGLVDVEGTIDGTGQIAMLSNYTGGNNFGLTLWGGGSLSLYGPALLNYGQHTTTAVATFLLSGGLQLKGHSTACSLGLGPGPATWNCGISLTPAALDAPVGASGFGGLASDGAGTSYVNVTNTGR